MCSLYSVVFYNAVTQPIDEDEGLKDKALNHFYLCFHPFQSSFFNAVTQPIDEDEGARVAAFPFTTLDPQTGRGFAVVPDPCALLSPEVASR